MNTFIFDLDGTLLPMNQDLFVETYFKVLAKKMAPLGLDVEKMLKAIWVGTSAMIENDGAITNEQRFWNTFCGIMGEEVRKLEPEFEHFYLNEFNKAKETTSPNPLAKKCIELVKAKGYRLALATNPIFPRVATLQRIQWAGLDPEDFDYISTYENSSFCKPNLEYYKLILENIGKRAEECIMVGNDVSEDMCAAQLGMDTFLLTECIINSKEVDISNLRQGCFEDLYQFIESLPNVNIKPAI